MKEKLIIKIHRFGIEHVLDVEKQKLLKKIQMVLV